MARYFIEQIVQPGTTSLQLDAQAADFLSNALRLQKGDMITICDGAGMDLLCQIMELNYKKAELRIMSQAENNTEPYYEVHLFQGLLKGEKMTDVIQRSVELGVHKIIPVSCQHSIVHVNEKNESKKMQRWTRVATAAASQARRGIVPQLLPVMSFADSLLRAAVADLALLVTDREDAAAIRPRLLEFSQLCANQLKKPVISLFTGPEGDWSADEIAAAKAAGCQVVSLGRRSLQAENAGPAALAMLLYQLDQF